MPLRLSAPRHRLTPRWRRCTTTCWQLLSSVDSLSTEESPLTLFDNRLGQFLTGGLPDSKADADPWAAIDIVLDLPDEMLLPLIADS